MKTTVLGVVALSVIGSLTATANAVHCWNTYTDCTGKVNTIEGDCPTCANPPQYTQGCSYVVTYGPLDCIKSMAVSCGNGCNQQ